MSTSVYGAALRQWRQTRGLSQLELSIRSGMSQRHISFLETGRSRPGRDTVLRLGDALEVAPREMNRLLVTAGHAKEFPETMLGEMGWLSEVLDVILRAHEPNVALVVDRHWDVVRSNAAATAFMGRLFATPPEWLAPPPNVMRLLLHEHGLRGHMRGWEATASLLVRRLERDAASQPHDEGLQALLEEVRSYPGVAALPGRGRAVGSAGGAGGLADLVVPTTFVIEGAEVSLLTTIMTIGDANDLTLSELRLETFWPADPGSAQRWQRLFVPGDANSPGLSTTDALGVRS